MSILRVLDTIGERVHRWRFRGKCGTCAHFAGTIGRADDVTDPGTDGTCVNADGPLYGVGVFQRSSCGSYRAASVAP
jgi:hypothetical protein